jgi:hypothetical protein
MKENFTFAPRTHLHDEGDNVVARGRLYQRLGRIFLVAAAFGGGVEITVNALLGGTIVPVTLRSVLDVATDARMPGPIGLVVDSPLWVVFLIAAAIPYAISVCLFGKQRTVSNGTSRGAGRL